MYGIRCLHFGGVFPLDLCGVLAPGVFGLLEGKRAWYRAFCDVAVPAIFTSVARLSVSLAQSNEDLAEGDMGSSQAVGAVTVWITAPATMAVCESSTWALAGTSIEFVALSGRS